MEAEREKLVAEVDHLLRCVRRMTRREPSTLSEIEQRLTSWTGRAVFPRDVYYFKEIPTNTDPWSVALVNLGAVAIAVVFSLLPAYRAARLHPVRALRFE